MKARGRKAAESHGTGPALRRRAAASAAPALAEATIAAPAPAEPALAEPALSAPAPARGGPVRGGPARGGPAARSASKEAHPPAGQTRATAAYRRMRDDILSGLLAPNSKLLMRELQDRYALGLAPLREALARLHAEELVQFSDHRGYWVCPISIEELNDLTHMRLLLEEEALRTSIAKGDDAWEVGVVASFHRLARLTERGAHLAEATLSEWETAHEDFHRSLIAAAGSRLLLRLRASLAQLVRRYRMFALDDAANRDHLAEHRAIQDATVAREADLAVRLLAEHYDLTTRAILARFEDDKP